jgi:enoyl-CoA hydratase/carnithine racemase
MTDDVLVRLERRGDGVAVVTLQNGKVNALSGAVLEQLHAVARELAADLPGAVVVTGSERFFAAGADIAGFEPGDPAHARALGGRIHAAFDALGNLPRLVIAAVSGYALGGGCELALACDYRIAADTAVFGQPEILLGILPGGGGTQRLPRVVGPARAKELILTGRQVTADEALRIGLADEVVPAADLLSRALALGAECARGALTAQGLAKRAIDRGLGKDLAGGLLDELDAFEAVFATDDCRIGIESFLASGPGKAAFTGH